VLFYVRTLAGSAAYLQAKCRTKQVGVGSVRLPSPVGIAVSIFFCGESLLYISAILPSVGIPFHSSFAESGSVACMQHCRKAAFIRLSMLKPL
jgi:hypothetical protein